MMKLDAMHMLRLTYISFMLELIFHSWIGDVCEAFSYMKDQVVVVALIPRKLELHFLVVGISNLFEGASYVVRVYPTLSSLE